MRVNSTELKLEIKPMKIRRFRREPIEFREDISVAAIKYHDIVTNRDCIVSKDSYVKPKYLSFIAASAPNAEIDSKPSGRNKIED